MIIKNTLGSSDGFYAQNEVQFLGERINFKFMTPNQLNQSLVDAINLYNITFPPPKDSFFKKAFKAAVIGGIVLGTGGAVLAAYGINVSSAVSLAKMYGTATASTGGTIAAVQSGATAIAVGGALYGKVSGESPPQLVKAANLVSSKNALDVMEKLAVNELNKKGAKIQEGNIAAKNALREKLRREQEKLAAGLREQAAKKSLASGNTPPNNSDTLKMILSAAAVATPFLLS